MEKRFYLGVGILVLFLALGLCISLGLSRIHEPVSQQFSHAAQKALGGDLDAGIAIARQAKTRWQKYRNITASVADHTPMDEVERLLAEMEVFAGAGEETHFAACCAQLSRVVQSISDAHDPGWENIL